MAIPPISYSSYQYSNVNFKGTNLVNVTQKQTKNLKKVFLGLAGLLGYKVIQDNNKDFKVTLIGAGTKGVMIDYIDSNGEFQSQFFKQDEREKMMNFLSENYGVELEKSSTASTSNNQAISIKEDQNGISVYVGQRGKFIPTFDLTRNETQQTQQAPMVTSLREQYIPNIRNRAETTGQQVKTELSQGVKDLISQGIMTQKEAEMFNEIYNLEGEEFSRTAYNLIAKSMGLTEYPKFNFAPLKNAEAHCGGTGITLNSEAKLSKSNILGILRHELEHYKQNVEVVKEFGINKYLRAEQASIMHKFIETPGYCYSRFGRTWDELSMMEQYKAIMEEMNHRYPGGIENGELKLLQRATGNMEEIDKSFFTRRRCYGADFDEMFIKGDLAKIHGQRIIANSTNLRGCYTSKAHQYLCEKSNYLSLSDVPINKSVFDGGRYTPEDLKIIFERIEDQYKNCSIEANAFREEGIIEKMWSTFLAICEK